MTFGNARSTSSRIPPAWRRAAGARRAIRAGAGTTRNARDTRRRSLRCDMLALERSAKNSHSAISDRKSERSSRKSRCAWSAACARCERPLARIRDGQRARDDQRFGQAAAVARRQHDAADARIERQPREFAAERRQRALPRRPRPAPAAAGSRRRPRAAAAARGTETRRRRAQVERRHAQDHGGQRRAQDFRIGVRRARVEILLVVQAHADAVLHAAAAAGALVGGRPARSSRSAAASSCCARL